MRRRKFNFHKRDRNMDIAMTAGMAARFENKPLTACPNLILVRDFDRLYADALSKQWMEGWRLVDRRFREQPEAPEVRV